MAVFIENLTDDNELTPWAQGVLGLLTVRARQRFYCSCPQLKQLSCYALPVRAQISSLATGIGSGDTCSLVLDPGTPDVLRQSAAEVFTFYKGSL